METSRYMVNRQGGLGSFDGGNQALIQQLVATSKSFSNQGKFELMPLTTLVPFDGNVLLSQGIAPPMGHALQEEKENLPSQTKPQIMKGGENFFPLQELSSGRISPQNGAVLQDLQKQLQERHLKLTTSAALPQAFAFAQQIPCAALPTPFTSASTPVVVPAAVPAAPAASTAPADPSPIECLPKQSSTESVSSTESGRKSRAECQLVKIGKRMDLLASADELGMICRRRHRENMYFDCKDKYSYSCNVKMILRPQKLKFRQPVPDQDERIYELLRRGHHNEHLSCQEKNPRGLSKRAKFHLREMLKNNVITSARDLFDMLKTRYPEDLRPDTTLRQVQNFINHEKAVGEIREKKQKQKLTALAKAPPSMKSSDKQKMLQGLPKLALPKAVRKVPAEKLQRNQKRSSDASEEDEEDAKKVARKKRLSEVAVEALQAMRHSRVRRTEPPAMTTLVFVPSGNAMHTLTPLQEEV